MSMELKHNSRKLAFSPFHSQLFLSTDAAWIEQIQCCGLGFVLVKGYLDWLF